MINEEILEEKLKYLIIMNSKPNFDIQELNVEIELLDVTKADTIKSYDINVKFDYLGALDFDMRSFAEGIQMMSEKFGNIVGEYIISKEGKIIPGNESDIYSDEPMLWGATYSADTTHIFEMTYRFSYDLD